MRCIIARFPFELTKSEVQESMKGIKPEPITGPSVQIGRRSYPVKQVGEVITRQDRRDFSAGEVVRALTRLGFTCSEATEPAPARGTSPMGNASAMLGGPSPTDQSSTPWGGGATWGEDSALGDTNQK